MLLAAGPAALVGVALAWLLARPEGPEPSSVVRVLALGLGSTVLGAGVMWAIGREDRRRADTADTVRPVAAIAGGWAIAEAVHLALAAGEATGGGGTTLADFRYFVTDVATGRVGAATLALVVAATAVLVAAYRTGWDRAYVPVVVLAAVALVARPAAGHMAQQPFGSVLDSIHVLAAAVWIGVLGALALTVRGRSGWALWLPRYSTLAWRCVLALTVTGVVDAAVALGDPLALVSTGYGRIVVAKAVVLVGLLALARRWRRTWVPDAERHRVTAEGSLRRAVAEVIVMAVAFGLAAALATTA
ncbi:copper resistance protein CopD [Rhodococcus rhodnii]|uniref:Copper resistance protein n=2 Tax=Rhodococcus rhodnii TaxID=38312 RepID=R7WH37_9NOCA|nr:CopD family protein [Rhodococcus rhodnii]EOM74307.1 copper resistance protein [Rhodococcus rhodnii LMG 5362]TXG92386.1 copper resistance protein CopD [Rhodococcus rhodnii]